MTTARRTFLAQLSVLAAALAKAAERLPANQNVKWAVSLNLWTHLPPCPFTDILDVMKDTGFIGIRVTGFPGFLQKYQLTLPQLHREVSRRNLDIATISWNAPLQDPAQREKVMESARDAMKFLADFGANHLLVFSPARTASASNAPGAFRELCERCNQVGELAGKMGFTAGLHNHLGQMVQNQDEVDRFMSMTRSQALRLVSGHGPSAPGGLRRGRNHQPIQEPDSFSRLQGRQVDDSHARLGSAEWTRSAQRFIRGAVSRQHLRLGRW